MLSDLEFVDERWKEMPALNPRVKSDETLWRMFLKQFKVTCVRGEIAEMRRKDMLSRSVIGFVYLKMDDAASGGKSFICESVAEVPLNVLLKFNLLRDAGFTAKERQEKHEENFFWDGRPVAARLFAKVRKGIVNRFIH